MPHQPITYIALSAPTQDVHRAGAHVAEPRVAALNVPVRVRICNENKPTFLFHEFHVI